MNYADESTSWNRIIQHRHFTKSKSTKDFITYEYSKDYTGDNEPFYPINDEANNEIYEKYKSYSETYSSNLIIGGRLGNYRYYDMDMTIANALSVCKKELAG
jgi:UDP-galactopyranose mutase